MSDGQFVLAMIAGQAISAGLYFGARAYVKREQHRCRRCGLLSPKVLHLRLHESFSDGRAPSTRDYTQVCLMCRDLIFAALIDEAKRDNALLIRDGVPLEAESGAAWILGAGRPERLDPDRR